MGILDHIKLIFMSEEEKIGLAENPNTPKDILIKLSGDEDGDVRKRVAGNSNTPKDILVKLSEDETGDVREAVAENPNRPEGVYTRKEKRELTGNPSTPKDILVKLSEDKNESIRRGVAENPNTPKDILIKLSEDEDFRAGVAENPNTPKDILVKLSEDEEGDVRERVAKNPNTPKDILVKLSEDGDGDVRSEVAKNPNTPKDILIKLSESPEVKQSIGDKWEAAMEYLNSDSFHQEIERAKRARDHASVEDWKRKGSPGLGQQHSCHMCHNIMYGEETVITLQKGALAQNNFLEAQRIEQRSGYRCKSCGKEFCKDCIEKKAPSNNYGGKSCPKCGGLFDIIHG